MSGDGRTTRIGRAGFTLVELLVVVAIIGIIISAILVAASDGVRRAEEKATQSLITKLGVAVEDRIDALFNTQAPVNYVHRYLAGVYYNNGAAIVPVPGTVNARAQVFAQNDFIRAEFPDVFYRNDLTSDGAGFAGKYPLNFAGIAFPPSNPAGNETEYFLPLGHARRSYFDPDPNFTTPAIDVVGATGVFGASFSAAGGIYKNLGYPSKAYDGVDNTNNGYIDELGEAGFSATQLNEFNAKIANHTHKTARSEMLYAVLVEGLGPLGSVFGRDDFTDKEVRDTDGDGLPEFVDAWGEPLQFYRWPIYYGAVIGTSDSQIGSLPYTSASQVRQQDPFDPNQQLTAPGWWYNMANRPFPASRGLAVSFAGQDTSTNANMSQGAMAFATYFRSLIDPASSTTAGTQWDRTGALNRRAYLSKPLILSGGPDKEPGVAQFDKRYQGLVDNPTGVVSLAPFPAKTLGKISDISGYLIQIENQAGQTDPYPGSARSGSFYEKTSNTAVTNYLQNNAGADDISNHNISAPGTGVR